MTNPLVSGTVQSGGSDGALPLAGAIVYLYRATEGEPFLEGAGQTREDGSFSFHVSRRPGDHVYYATARLPGGILLASVVETEIGDPITLNELTTVAAAFSMAQFIDGSEIRRSTSALRIAAGMNANLVSARTGQPSPVMLEPPNADETNSLRSLRALANLLAPTVRGRPGAWDTLRALATTPRGGAPADTFQAIASIARHPAFRVASIYQQAQEMEIYTPSLAVPPDAWTLAVKVNRTGGVGERSMFGGPANIAWDGNGYAWIANNVFQGTPNSCDFVVVLKPDGTPADGVHATVKSPVVGGGLLGPGFGITIDGRQDVWVGSFGWGPQDTFPTAGIVSKFDELGRPLAPDGYTAGTVRVQGVAADGENNIWSASYQDDTVAVYPRGDPAACFTYPANDSSDPKPGSCTFGIAIDHTEETPTAWVTYSGGLGWPTANPGAVAKFQVVDHALQLVFSTALGKALKGNAVDAHGNAWVASGGDDTVYVVTPDQQITGFTDRGGLCGPWGVAVDGGGDVWVANFGHMGVTKDYTNACISRLAGVDSPSGLPLGEAISPETGYTLPTGGSPVTLPDGRPLYEDGTPCYSPLMRQTSVSIDQAGNVWAVNNWKPRFGTDFPPQHGNPGGDGVVILVGLARPPAAS